MFWQYCPAYRSLEEPIKFLDWFSVLPGRILAITNNEENQWNKMKALANYLLGWPWPQSIGGFTKESCHHHQIPFPVGGERLRMPVVVKSSHRSRWNIFIVKFAQLVHLTVSRGSPWLLRKYNSMTSRLLLSNPCWSIPDFLEILLSIVSVV